MDENAGRRYVGRRLGMSEGGRKPPPRSIHSTGRMGDPLSVASAPRVFPTEKDSAPWTSFWVSQISGRRGTL